MINPTENLNIVIDDALPNHKIIHDVQEEMRDDNNSDTISVEISGKFISVPLDVPIFVITKAFFKEYYSLPFGTYRVMVSLGQPVETKGKSLKPLYCFVTLWYNDDLQVITSDFHGDMR